MESRVRLGGMNMRKFRGLVLPAAMLAGCAAPGAPAPVPPVPERYALDPEQPAEVCRPEGGRRYLARPICPSGEPPAFNRTGNVGPRTPLPLDRSRAEREGLLPDTMGMTPSPKGEADPHG